MPLVAEKKLKSRREFVFAECELGPHKCRVFSGSLRGELSESSFDSFSSFSIEIMKGVVEIDLLPIITDYGISEKLIDNLINQKI
jgi:hypothetical protein